MVDQKQGLIDQWEQMISLKQAYKEAEREWVKCCSEMKPSLDMVRYITDNLRKSPNHQNEKNWLSKVGLTDMDISFTGSSCGSSASSISPARRQQIMSQIASRPITPNSGQQFAQPLQQQFPQQFTLQPQLQIHQQFPSQSFQPVQGPVPMVVDQHQPSQSERILLVLEGLRADIGEMKEEVGELKSRQDRIEGL